jgi:hypothetical protein
MSPWVNISESWYESEAVVLVVSAGGPQASPAQFRTPISRRILYDIAVCVTRVWARSYDVATLAPRWLTKHFK